LSGSRPQLDRLQPRQEFLPSEINCPAFLFAGPLASQFLILPKRTDPQQQQSRTSRRNRAEKQHVPAGQD